MSASKSPQRTIRAVRGTTLSEYAARVIKDLILWEEIPPGTRLGEADLAERLGISRTPVREALRWLQAESIVVRQGGGLAAAPFDEDEALELLTLRQMIEPFVCSESAQRLTRRDLSQLRSKSAEMRDVVDEWDEASVREMAELELEFHRLLASRCPHRRIAAIVEQARDTHSLLRMHRHQTAQQREAVLAEHHHLVEVGAQVAEGSAPPSAMSDAMAEHLSLSKTYFVAFVNDEGDSDDGDDGRSPSSGPLDGETDPAPQEPRSADARQRPRRVSARRGKGSPGGAKAKRRDQ